MGGTLGSLGSVTAVFDAQTDQFDKKVVASSQKVDVGARAIANATKRQADAVAFAAKFAGDAVSTQSIRMVSLMKAEASASADYRKMQALSRSGLLDEATAAKATAAAYQRLTEAKRATSVPASGAGLGGSIIGVAGIAMLGEAANKMREAVQESLSFGREIERMSQKTGLAVGTLSTLHYAAAITGGDFETMSKAVAKMDKTIGAATEGDKKAEGLLRSLGLNAADLAGRTDGAEIAFRKMAQTIAQTESPIRRIELATGLLGKAGAEQIPTLIQVGNNWDYFKQKATDAGVQLDGQTAEALTKSNRQLEDLKQKLFGAGLGFTQGLNPGLQEFFRLMSGGGSNFGIMQTFGEIAGRGIAVATAAFWDMAESMAEVMYYVDKARGDSAGAAADKIVSADDKRREDDALYFAKNGRPRRMGESRSEHNALVGVTGTGGDGGFTGTGGGGNADKEAEKRLKADEAQVAMIKLDGEYTAKAEFDYWSRRISSYTQGSQAYNAIVEKQAALAMEGAKHAHELITKGMKAYYENQNLNSEGADKAVEAISEKIRQQGEDVSRTGLRWEEYNKQLQRAAELQARQDAAMQELRIARGMATGSISRADGESQLDNARQAAFAAEIADLRNELEQVRADGRNLDPNSKDYETRNPQNQAKQLELQGQIAQLQGQAGLDAQKAKWQAFEDTALGGAITALQKFAVEATDFAGQMSKLTGTVLNDVNGAILKDLTSRNRSDRRNVWTDAGRSIFTSAADAGLKGAEGSLLKAFGIGAGKRDGSQSAPFYVISAGTGVGGAASAIAKATGGGSGFLSGILSGFHIPGFAEGTSSAPGGLAWVGERGKELVNLPKGASVTPNHALSSMGGSPTIHVDARGASDPAQTAAMVHEAIMAAAPHIMAGANAAYTRSKTSLPASRRNF